MKPSGTGRFARQMTLIMGVTLVVAMGLVNWLLLRAARTHLEREEIEHITGTERPEHHLGELREATLATTGASLIITLALALLLTRPLNRSVAALSRLAQRLLAGDYGARLPELGDDEFGDLGRTLNVMADRVQAEIAELSRQKSRLETILGNMVEAVIAVDARGIITSANPALCALLGTAREKLEGAPFETVLGETNLIPLLKRALSQAETHVAEVALGRQSPRLFEARAARLLAPDGAAGALVVLHDVTRVRRLEQASREFVANASHELRTPLASISAFAELLGRPAPCSEPQRVEFADEISRSSRRLSRLVEDLLDLSALESGQRPLKRRPVALAKALREAAAALQPLATERKIRLDIDAPHDLQVSADAAQLKQVLVNLLDNAIKFNHPEGRVAVSAAPRESGVLVRIEDSGAGIPSEDLPKVFDRFYRAGAIDSSEHPGAGLGLSIVKRIVDDHAGRIGLESSEGRGTTALLWLPG